MIDHDLAYDRQWQAHGRAMGGSPSSVDSCTHQASTSALCTGTGINPHADTALRYYHSCQVIYFTGILSGSRILEDIFPTW